MDVKLYLALAGSLGVAYVAYNMYSKPRIVTINYNLTRRICQQIKHQMLIACISYSKAMKKIRQENADKILGKEEQIFANFRNELSQIYVAKENLILKKYAVTRETYGKALQKFKKDKLLLKNTEEIITMMERSISGFLPDFTIAPQAHQAFNKEQLSEIYKDMVTLIAKKVTQKLQEQVDRNKHFNPNSDDDFRNAIRELGIYDIKVSFLKEKGFKEEWGCPNEVFFKFLESQKAKDAPYEKKIVAYEHCYEKIIEIVSIDPKKMNDRQIHEMFEKALNASSAPAKPSVPAVVQPARVAPVQVPKPVIAPPKAVAKSQPVDEEAELEMLMMQELYNRSQEPVRSVSVESSLGESIKLGMTTSQIQNDWEKHASFNQKTENKFEEAKDDVAIGLEDSKLIKKEMKVIEEALREQENQQNKPDEELEVNELQIKESEVEVKNAQEKVEEENLEAPAPAILVDAEPIPNVEEPTVVVVEQVIIEERVEVVVEAKVEEAENQVDKPEQKEEEKQEDQEVDLEVEGNA